MKVTAEMMTQIVSVTGATITSPVRKFVRVRCSSEGFVAFARRGFRAMTVFP